MSAGIGDDSLAVGKGDEDGFGEIHATGYYDQTRASFSEFCRIFPAGAGSFLPSFASEEAAKSRRGAWVAASALSGGRFGQVSGAEAAAIAAGAVGAVAEVFSVGKRLPPVALRKFLLAAQFPALPKPRPQAL